MAACWAGRPSAEPFSPNFATPRRASFLPTRMSCRSFCLFFGGDYGEKYGRRDVQFRPFTFSFRPAGVPHQDEVGPARRAHVRHRRLSDECQRSLTRGSGNLGIAYDFEGGEFLWLGLKLYSETRTPLGAHDLQVESLVSELLGAVACKPERCTVAPFWLRRILDKAEHRVPPTAHHGRTGARSRRTSRTSVAGLSPRSPARASENMCIACASAKPVRRMTQSRCLAGRNQLRPRLRRPEPLHAHLSQHHRNQSGRISREGLEPLVTTSAASPSLRPS